MKRLFFIPFLAVVLVGTGCRQVERGIRVSRLAVDEFHEKDAFDLCALFSEEMVSALPCEALDRVIRQTVDTVGEPEGKCRWAFTYRILEFDPLRTVTVYKCPFAREKVKVSVVVDADENKVVVSGFWIDSESIRKQRLLLEVKLCMDVDRHSLLCEEPLEKASWNSEAIYVWTSWQRIKPGDKLIMEWHSPDGMEVADYMHEAKKHHSDVYYFFSWINPKDVEVENPYGTWTVKIGIKGKLIEEHPVPIIPED